LITSERGSGTMNLGPALSPDGRRVAFLSERNVGDVELLMANAETGEVIRRLQGGTGFDSHYQSLRYIQSAGTWSPDGRQFAFSALRQGRDVLVLVDTDRGRRIREIDIPGVGELTSPTWSPDGRTIVVAGIAGGISDLYALDLETGSARRLTNDRYADLQPAYSPDGQRIAFVTDRFGTDLRALDYGAYELAVYDVATGAITAVPEMAGAKNSNPQWAPDGSALYFISDRTGIPNVYRVNVADGVLTQVTNIFSGVSGITEMSPALTVARNADVLLFTAFEDNGFNIYSITERSRLAGSAPESNSESVAIAAAGLPPTPRPSEAAFNRVASYLADKTTGLPPAEDAVAYEATPYRAKLGLDYLGQPQIGVAIGGGPFGGAGLQGGITGLFSDILGGHSVGAVIQAQGEWDEVGGAVQYLNTEGRWSYGAGIQRIPYIYGYYAEGFDGDDYVQQLVRERVFDAGLMGYASYPMSPVQRVDFSAGFRRLSMDQRVQEVRYDMNTGFGRASQAKFDGPAYNLAETSVAWVFDSAVFGYTAPIAGQRARISVAPTAGDLQFVSTTVDLRRYAHLRPFTLAIRGLHFGRYGPDGEGTFSDIYLGNSSLLRGYSSLASNCFETGQGCDFDQRQLLGSRLAVVSAELRMPLVRYAASGGGFALPPIDAHLFYDAGVAWTSDTSPSFELGALSDPAKRGLLTSAGVGIRTNVFGLMILEVDYVRAFALGDNWRWVFSIQPGF
jgi:Tol biopolymer transport system component